jgi:diaminopimelate epimerase
MKKVSFTKMQATGNDFILVREKSAAPQRFWTGKRAWLICDRHLGVGADGLIVLHTPNRHGTHEFRIFNADGSPAETCLNGLRCAALLVSQGTEETVFLPPAGPAITRVIRRNGPVAMVQVDLGFPQYQALSLPALKWGRTRQPVTAIAAGNPHLVVLVQDFDFDWVAAASRVQNESIFPCGANVDFVRVVDRRTVEVRFVERGVGPTLSCGSGAVASALCAMREDLVGNSVDLLVPGGKLRVDYHPRADRLYLTGPAVNIYSGEINLE